MKSTQIQTTQYQCEGCGFTSTDPLEVLQCEKVCIHQKTCFHENLEYDCDWERRSSQMHCTKCGKHGSGKELREEGLKHKKDYEEYS